MSFGCGTGRLCDGTGLLVRGSADARALSSLRFCSIAAARARVCCSKSAADNTVALGGFVRTDSALSGPSVLFLPIRPVFTLTGVL